MLPVTFTYSLSSEEMKEAVTKVIDMLIQEDFHGAFQKLLEQYKCIVLVEIPLTRFEEFWPLPKESLRKLP